MGQCCSRAAVNEGEDGAPCELPSAAKTQVQQRQRREPVATHLATLEFTEALKVIN
jgi:hypothetical protein